jgi:hypothetical protein
MLCMTKIITGVALGVALWLIIYNNSATIIAFMTWIISMIFSWIYKAFTWIIDVITRPFRYLLGITKPQLDKKIQKKEEEKEEEYQAALAKWDKYAKISKDAYFLHKIEKERKAEQKKIQAKIDKYWSNISDEEAERLDRIKKQKAEYDALPQEEKDKLKKKRKRDWIIIIICLSIVMLPSIIMAILSALGIM